jgi:flagellar biosynthesis/type III secretory pathway M-ring protein FliF/YscJ
VLREFNGVKQARVLLNLNAWPRGFARNRPEATAGVTLFLANGEPVSRSLALAAARMVAGAVRGLPVKNVQVIDGGNGRVALDWDGAEEGSASALHRERRQLEREKELQIKEQLSFDRNALVSVSCELDHTSLHVQDSVPSEGVLLKEGSESSNTTRKQRSGQPGVQPNTGIEVTGEAGGDSSTSERRESTYTPGVKTSTQEIPAGAVKQITAAVSLSYSYLTNVYQLNNPDADPPTETQIEEVFAKQKEKVLTHVAKLVIPPEPEQVSVVWHYDMLEPERPEETGALDSTFGMVRKYGPASGLALLAVLALGMMLRVAKRRDSGETFGMDIGLPAEALAAAKQAAQDLKPGTPAAAATRATGAGALPGAASVGPAAAMPAAVAANIPEAPQLDEAATQVNQMLTQVREMMDQDGDAVATLVEHLINHER